MCRKKGFTLVELLIVIVVIGVLSAMMMLSSTEAVSSAKATNIINNLRNWKTATLEYYADHLDEVEGFNNSGKTAFTNFADFVDAPDIIPYLGGEFKTKVKSHTGDTESVQDASGLIYFTDHVTNVWLIACQFPDDEKIKEKLEARAVSTGLVGKDLKPYKANGTNSFIVWIIVNDFRNN